MRYALAMLLGVLAGAAFAKLPPPTPEEKAKLEKAAAEKKATTEKQKQELEKKQEEVARAYRQRHAMAPQLPAQAVQQPLKKTDVPKSAKQPVGEKAHPYAGRKAKPQGQAHSSN